jgi:hypothetical protein
LSSDEYRVHTGWSIIMAETVTLHMPEAVMLRAQERARRTGQSLEEVLQEWLEQGAASDDSTLLVSAREYPLFTPYGNEPAAQVLLDALAVARTIEHHTRQSTPSP